MVIRLRSSGEVQMTNWVRIRKKLRLLVRIIKRPGEKSGKRRLNFGNVTYGDLQAGQLNLKRAKEKGLMNKSEDAVGFFFGGLYVHGSERLRLHERRELDVC